MPARRPGPGSRPGAGRGRPRPPAARPGKVGARPTASRTKRPSGAAAQTVREPLRASMTGRAAILALVLGMLAVSYAYPLRAWYDQHQEREALREETERLEESVEELEAEVRLWDDPAYVRAQARERLGYVMPGEIGFIVAAEPEPEPELGPDGLPVPPDATWYDRLWTSVRAADQPSESP